MAAPLREVLNAIFRATPFPHRTIPKYQCESFSISFAFNNLAHIVHSFIAQPLTFYLIDNNSL